MTAEIPAAVRRRLAEVAHRFSLEDDVVAALDRLLELVVSDPHAPTAVRDARRVVDDHLADSLVALDLPELRAASRLADLGSGGGFPCLPIAAALPSLQATAVESTARKCSFIAQSAAQAGIANVEVACVRAEEWSEGREANDVVTARALASLAVVAEYAAPLLRVGGTLVAWRGRRDAAEEGMAARAAAELGLRAGAVIRVQPYPAAVDRHLHLFHKAQATPARFPRRAGMARKHPLGG